VFDGMELLLTGERTLPGIPHENYWFAHEYDPGHGANRETHLDLQKQLASLRAGSRPCRSSDGPGTAPVRPLLAPQSQT
jgi:hypothetical protein